MKTEGDRGDYRNIENKKRKVILESLSILPFVFCHLSAPAGFVSDNPSNRPSHDHGYPRYLKLTDYRHLAAFSAPIRYFAVSGSPVPSRMISSSDTRPPRV